MSRRAGIGLALALTLGGCFHLGGDAVLSVTNVVAIAARDGGGVSVCAVYHTEHEDFDGGSQLTAHNRPIDLDGHGGETDHPDGCAAAASQAVGNQLPLPDGRLELGPLDAKLTRVGSNGEPVWSVPSPFGRLFGVLGLDDAVYLADGPEVARVSLIDGSVTWVVELR